jgi:hypothetical protein
MFQRQQILTSSNLIMNLEVHSSRGERGGVGIYRKYIDRQ